MLLSYVSLSQHYLFRLGLLGNSFTASGSIDYGYGKLNRQLGRRDFISFVLALLISISILSACILTLFLSLISIVLFPCTGVRENTPTWIPHFLYAYTEWYLHFSQGKILLTFARVLLVKNKPIIIIVVYLNLPTGDKTPYQCKISKTYLSNT